LYKSDGEAQAHLRELNNSRVVVDKLKKDMETLSHELKSKWTTAQKEIAEMKSDIFTALTETKARGQNTYTTLIEQYQNKMTTMISEHKEACANIGKYYEETIKLLGSPESIATALSTMGGEIHQRLQ
jgi:ElaB/YqjD/DUF883 family membrane-anchored ribosome-binding protein